MPTTRYVPNESKRCKHGLNVALRQGRDFLEYRKLPPNSALIRHYLHCFESALALLVADVQSQVIDEPLLPAVAPA